MDLQLDPAGLRADASALQGSAAAGAGAPGCPAAAADSVSAHLAAALSSWAQSLHVLHEHAGELRSAGGLALNGTALALTGADDENASAISRIMDGAAAGALSPSAPPVGGAPQVAAPTLPVCPVMMPPVPLPAEQIAANVHAGPGPSSLRTFASTIRQTLAVAVSDTAVNVRNAGQSVADNWQDQQQQASNNIASHANWLESDLHPHVVALAKAADEAAQHTETLIRNTPHPQEFADLNQRLKVAMAQYNATGGLNAAQVATLSNELSHKRSAAMAAYQTFSTAAPPTISGGSQPLAPAPPIVIDPGGDVNGLQPTAPAGDHDGPSDGKHRGGHGPGDPAAPNPADPADAGSAAPQPSPGLAAPPTGPAAAQDSFANIAGLLMGAGTGAVGQVAHGLGGGGSPLSALSSLSSLPGMGGTPHMGQPSMPDGGGGQPDGSSPSGLGDGDFGSGGTDPAAGGGGGDGGAPVSSSSPAVGPPTGSTVSAGAPAPTGPAPASGGMAGGMGGMMPPVGGMGGKSEEARKSEERRRVVMRPVANTEAVFGQVRTEPRRRRDPDKKT